MVRMLMQFFKEVLQKGFEYVAELAISNVLNIKNFGHILETLQVNSNLLSAKVCGVEEEIKNGELSGRKKRKREVEEWLERVKSIEKEVYELGREADSKGFFQRFLDGGKAAQLNEKVEKLYQQSLNFGKPVLDARGTSRETLPTKVMVGEAFNGYFETVLKLLEDRQVSKIGVYGMGGVGKTTLAKHIHNQLRQQSQGCVFWITVSDQEFPVKSLQNKLARYLGVDLSDEDEEAVRAGRLNRFLSQKKNSVLILDDVWEMIDMLKVGCTFSVDGCRLIITTRTLNVCRQIGCDEVIPVEKLGKDESWNLFKITLGNEIQLCPRMEEVAKSMAKQCDGLPLGIVTMAGSMKGETSIDTWENALTELEDSCSSGGQNETAKVDEVFRVLKYSFNRLNTTRQNQNNEFNTFQNCFMYCSLYPEDYEFGRDDLVREFISDGLLDERRSGRAQVVQGRSILDKLVNVCLLETCVDPWNRECVKMHDLVRGMALEIGKKKYMGRAYDDSLKEVTDVEEWTEDLEKVALLWSHIEIIEDGISPNCPNLSTLLLRNNRRLEAIPESFFSKLQGLCTLDLRACFAITMLPNSISDLTSLKSLILEHCERLEKVPYLGKMKALRELNLSGTAIEEVPQGLKELLNLRFLSMNARGLKMLPSGLLLNFRHLQHLHLPLELQVSMLEIENLRELEGFSGGVESVRDFNLFMKIHWVRGTCCYKIGVNAYDIDKPSTFVLGADMGCHENELLMCNHDLKEEKVLGQAIVCLEIRACKGLSKCFSDDLWERFDNPTSLKRLEIWWCGGIEWIMRRSDGQPSQLSSTLERIYLWELDDLKGVVMMERGEIRIGAPAQPIVFSSLKSVQIIRCNKVRKLGLATSGVPKLKKLAIYSCGEIEEIFKENEGTTTLTLPKLEKLALSNLPILRKLGLAASSVPNLKRLRISSCGEIEEIFKENEGRATDSTLTLPNLEELVLSKLTRLKKFGLTTSSVPNLKKLAINSCGEIEDIFKENEGRTTLTLPRFEELALSKLPRLRKLGLAELSVPNLKKLAISSCGEIEEIFKEIEGRAILTLPRLQELALSKLSRLSKLGIATSSAPNLKKLVISSCGEIEDIFKENEGRAILTLPRLEELALSELPRLRKLGLATSSVPNLKRLTINSCGEIEEIFKENEGRATDSTLTLPKLEELALSELPRLRKVGLSTRGFPNLEEIKISGCGEIEEIFEEDLATLVLPLTLPKLRGLELFDMPRLKRVSKAAIISNSIQYIWIKHCPKLMKKLPLDFDDQTPPPSLSRIEVEREWWESLDWDTHINPNLPQLLQPFLM